MKVFVLGGVEGNTGPTNVNAKLLEAWPNQDIIRTNHGTSIVRLLSGILGVFWSDCVIYSGGGNTSMLSLLLARIIKRSYVTIAHGFPPFENEINGLKRKRWQESLYLSNLRRSTLVVGVSKMQVEFIASHVTGLDNKKRYFHNGVEKRPSACLPHDKRPPIVAVSGGIRPIKNNSIVLEAVEKLNRSGFPCTLRLYGRTLAEGGKEFLAKAEASQYTEVMGQVSRDDFLNGLGEARVFVQNSLHESFGMSAIDALQSGCSLLISKNCGVNEVLSLEDGDIIDDILSPDEIAAKVFTLMNHPNAARLEASIDYSDCSWTVAVKRLRGFCIETLNLQSG